MLIATIICERLVKMCTYVALSLFHDQFFLLSLSPNIYVIHKFRKLSRPSEKRRRRKKFYATHTYIHLAYCFQKPARRVFSSAASSSSIKSGSVCVYSNIYLINADYFRFVIKIMYDKERKRRRRRRRKIR